MNNREKAEAIIKLLFDRKGFEYWWDDIREDDKADIYKALEALLKKLEAKDA